MPECIMGCIMVDRLNLCIFISKDKRKGGGNGHGIKLMFPCVNSMSVHITVKYVLASNIHNGK